MQRDVHNPRERSQSIPRQKWEVKDKQDSNEHVEDLDFEETKFWRNSFPFVNALNSFRASTLSLSYQIFQMKSLYLTFCVYFLRSDML